jgi:hypothetical protein
MANREPIQYVEVDVDYCDRSYGDGLCAATVSAVPSRTNLLKYSEDFSATEWVKTNSTITVNAAINPSQKATNAGKLIENTATSTHVVHQDVGSITGTNTFTFSMFVKPLERTNLFVRCSNLAVTNTFRGTFNLSTATAATSTTGTGTVAGATITPFPDGWFRISVTGSLGSASSDIRTLIGLRNSGVDTYTGDGTSGLLVWGAQLEVGANASFYLATLATQVSNTTASTGIRKCFNTYATCQSKSWYTKVAKKLTFINNRSNLPKGLVAYPVLKDNGISAFSSTVNVAGSNPRMNPFGRRASVTIALKDFVDDDIWFDKYQLQRISGAAQSSGIGYDPGAVGTFFTRLKARWPYYAGRPLRVVDGYVDDGVLTITQTRHFIITDMKGPDSEGNVSFEAKDVLALADDKKALAPAPSRGKLGAAVTAAVGQTFSLTPSGIEVEYPASGWAVIGTEVVTFTRSGATVTLTSRGQEGTVATAHSLGDTFQVALYIDGARIDDTIYDLLTTYAKVPTSFCPLVTEWEPEITRWMDGVLLKTVITKPTGVAQLVGELSDLGVSIWWDDVNQKVKLLATHPVSEELIVPVTDNLDIKQITQEDFDEDRVTQVHFYTKQSDPTKDYKDKNNYDRLNVLVDTESESINAYNDTKVREVPCRWLNNGADAIVRTLSLRLLKRLNTPPVHYTVLLDAQLKDINLADVIELDSRVATDEAGIPVKKLLQVIRRTEKKSGHEVEVEAQSFRYDGRYGQIMVAGSPVYGSASDTQKRLGAFMVGASLTFSDGSPPYSFI